MSILIDEKTKVIVQGITGSEGAFHTQQMLEYGTQIVAGVTPGKGGTTIRGVPVFHTVRDAQRETGAEATTIFVPPALAADAIMEAVDSGVRTVVCLTEGIPTMDMIAVKQCMKGKDVRLIGPNTPGVISPGQCKIGVMAGYIHTRGPVGIMSRSGTLTYEAVYQLTRKGIGQSTCVGIGGDPVIGLDFVDILMMFEKDEVTEAVVMIGEIGGSAEENAASYYRQYASKPVIAFIAGMSAPAGRRMGHAGAIISGGKGDAASKIRTLKEAGITMVENPAEIGAVVAEVIGKPRKSPV
jgi:succinyl-CoA synthetase alpha subunit